MNKVVITNKEINKIANTRLKGVLGKYKEEEYKEVFVYDNRVFIYDIYIKDWFLLWVVAETTFEFKEGFYNYSIIKEAISLFKNLNKDKIYVHRGKNKDKIHYTFLSYNKELSVWEEISTGYNKVIKTIAFNLYNLEFYKPITKKEFDKLLLISELVS